MVAPSPYYAASPLRRTAPSLPFGWGAVTVVLVGAALLIIGILLILYGFLNFLMGTIGQATSSSFSVMAFFQSFFGAIMLFVIGGVLAGIGGWLRSEEHTSELQSRLHLVCRLLLEKKKIRMYTYKTTAMK